MPWGGESKAERAARLNAKTWANSKHNSKKQDGGKHSEKKQVAVVHAIDRETGHKLAAQTFRGTPSEIDSEISNMRQSLGGQVDIVIKSRR